MVTTTEKVLWDIELSYSLVAFRGVNDDPANIIELQARTGQAEMMTSSGAARYSIGVVDAAEVPITWLLNLVDSRSMQLQFIIDREKTHTPSNNAHKKMAA